MSLRKGDRTKKAQKHQNRTSFKAGLHCQTGKKAKDAAAVVLAGLCARCKEKLEWKLKYDKYKPLTVPKKCLKTVKQAYYQICRECSETKEVCAKCGKKEDVVERYPPTAWELARDEAEFRAGLKRMTERERRTFLREEFGVGSRIQSKASAVFELTESSKKCRNDDHESTSDIDSEEAESNSNVDQTGFTSRV